MKNLLTLARQGKTALGMYVGDTGEAVAEIACYAGFDYLRIDCEHSLNDYTKVQNLIRIANASDVPTLVRISSLSDITRLLDFGASGILAPDISTAVQAREVARLAKFAPIGERGMTNMGRCVRYSDIPLGEYCKRANGEVAVAVQIESREGVKNLDEILSVEGIDIVTTGRQDFSQSYGVPGQANHPLVDEAENAVIAKGVARNVFPLITAGSPAAMETLKAKGVLLQTICFDGAFLMKQFKTLIASFRA